MLAAVLRETGAPLSLEEVELDEPGPGEVRIRIEAAGVTSMHSSPRQNSSACSIAMFFGGISRSSSSPVEERTLVSFFSRVMLTSMSSERAFSPTIMPSYTSVPGSTKRTPRSWRLTIAYAVTGPGRSATSEPETRVVIVPNHGS